MRAALALLAIGTVPVTACSPSDNDPGPGGVTVGEARALDEAAEMIEQRRIPADVLAEKELASESAASEATAPGPWPHNHRRAPGPGPGPSRSLVLCI